MKHDFKVGQIYRDSYGATREILAVGKLKVFTRHLQMDEEFSWRMDGGTVREWELVKPWFEVGREYKWPSGAVYTIHSLVEKDGIRAAVAWHQLSWSKGFVILGERDYDKTELVTK